MGGGGEARGGVQSVQKQYLYTPTRATECTAPTGNGNGMLTVLLFLFLSGATDGVVQRAGLAMSASCFQTPIPSSKPRDLPTDTDLVIP